MIQLFSLSNISSYKIIDKELAQKWQQISKNKLDINGISDTTEYVDDR